MKNINGWIAAVAAVSLVSFTAVAQTTATKKCEPGEHRQHINDDDDSVPGPRHRHIQKNRLPHYAGLDLTDTQKKTLADARTAQEPARRELHEKIRLAHEVLDKAADSGADEVTLTRLSNDIATLIAQNEVERIKMRRQFVSILTPEQKQKLDAFNAEHKDDRHWKDKDKDGKRNEWRDEKQKELK